MKEMDYVKIEKVKNIINKNKHLPVNEIKREVKKKFPDINVDKLIEIITSNGLLKDDGKGER